MQIYHDTFPVPLFVGLGVALTAAAVVVDSWRFTDPQELLLSTITLGALLSVASFRRFGGLEHRVAVVPGRRQA